MKCFAFGKIVHEDDSAVSNVVEIKVKSLYLAYLFDRLPNTKRKR